MASADAPVLALSFGDLNPLSWLGKGAAAIVTDVWKGAMVALWSAGMWMLKMVFLLIDQFTTPDLSAGGPLRQVLPITMFIGAAVAALMALIQFGTALYQRDGKSIGRIAVGIFQFGLVWVGYLAVAGTLVAATGGLTKGILQSMLHVDTFSGFTSNSDSWPRQVDDTVVATVLGLSAMFLILPAAIGYLLIMLVREAALMLLTVTAPISAGGLLSESSRTWFWKSLRWFIASLLIAPLAALVLGVGVQITHGTIEGNGDQTAQAVGMAVVGCVLVLIGALSPVVLFRLLAFVDPGTSSGAAMRTSLAANGGLAGLVGGGGGDGGGGSSATSGSGAASQSDGQGRSQGESSADSATSSRFAGAAAMGGAALGIGGAIGSAAAKAVNVGADILGAAGVGHQVPYFGQDASSGSYGNSTTSSGGEPAATPGSEAPDPKAPDPESPGPDGPADPRPPQQLPPGEPTPPTPPPPPPQRGPGASPTSPASGGPAGGAGAGAPAGAAGGGAAGAGAGGAAAAAAAL